MHGWNRFHQPISAGRQRRNASMRSRNSSTGYRASRATSRGQRAVVEALERRTLLSATYSNADINGTWSVAAMGASRSVTFDGAGNVTGGMFNNSDGTTSTPSGT